MSTKLIKFSRRLGALCLTLSLPFVTTFKILAQNVGINTTGAAPHPSAMLDVEANNRGLLIPRVSLTNVTVAAPVTSPATGLLVYNTNASVTGGSGTGFYYWNGSQWVKLESSVSSDWTILGNSGTNPAINFLGTTDNQPLVFRTNNTEQMRLSTNGHLGIGISGTNPHPLRVAKNVTGNYHTAGFTNATGQGVFVGSVNNASTWGSVQAYDAAANQPLPLILNNAGGNVGVGNITAPTERLHVAGNLRLDNAFMPNNDAGTAGSLLRSAGAGTAPVWIAPGSNGDLLTVSSGVPAWTAPSSLGGNFILNQNATDQAANFRITGTGRANTSFQAPVYTRADAGTVAIRPFSNSTTAIQLQNASGTSILNVDASNSNVGIGTVAPNQRLRVAGGNIWMDGNQELGWDWTNTDRASVRFESTGDASGQSRLILETSDNSDEPIEFRQTGNVRMVISNIGPGNVGIGTTTPSERLHVAGNLRLDNAFMPGNNAGTAGSLLRSAGAGTAPVWIAPGSNGDLLTVSSGVPAWTAPSSLGGNFILNQNATDQAANFRITGTGRANTSFQAPVYTRADAGTVAIRPFSNSTTAIQLQDAAGTSILNVDATNSRVGIGTTAPYTPLTIAHEASYTFPNPGSGATGAINIRMTTSNRQTGITFSQANMNNAQAGIYVHQDDAFGTHMYLATSGNYATGPQVRMTVLNNGNVGIGTINPVRVLHIERAGDATIRLRDPNDPVGDFWEIQSDAFLPNNFGIVRYAGSSALASNSMVLTAGGNMGIGTATPGYKLDVAGGSGTYIGVSANFPAGDATQGLAGYTWRNSADNSYFALYLADPDGGFGVTPRSWELWEYPSNVGPGTCCRPRFRVISSHGLADPGQVVIDQAGRLGINTSAPTERLHVAGNLRLDNAFMPGNDAGTAGSLLRSAGAGTAPVWIAPGANGDLLTVSGGLPAWTAPSALGGNFILNQNATDQAANFRITGTGRANTAFQAPVYTRADAGTVAIRPFSNSTTAIQLQNASGTSILNVDATNSRVGIGTTAPYTPLTIAHEASYTFPNPGSGATGAINIRMTTSNRQTGITFSQANTNNAQAGIYVHQDNTDGTHMYLATTDNYATGPQVRMTVRNNGNVGIGTLNPALRLDVGGNTRTQSLLVVTGANASEGGQITIGGPGDYTLTNENCTSWNIDIYNAAGVERFRIFRGTAGGSCSPLEAFNMRSDNGFVGLNRPLGINNPLHVGTDATNGNGAHVTAGGAWTNGSSREKKDRFTKLDPAEILMRINQLPVEGWYYKGTEEYHIGPYAEDFYAAFGTGVHEFIETDSTGKIVRRPNPEVDKYLAASDVAGVALLGVKGLMEENKALKEELTILKNELEEIKRRFNQLHVSFSQASFSQVER